MSKGNLDRRGWQILGGVALVVVAVLTTIFVQKVLRPNIGPDNCVYTDSKLLRRVPTDQAVLVIDQSEALTAGHVRGVTRKIEDFVLDDVAFPTGSRLLVYTFSKNDFPGLPGQVPSFRPAMDLCKPKGEGNPLNENSRRIRERFVKTFQGPFKQLLEKELGKDVGARSPILETLQMISRAQDIESWGHRKSLFVISDLLQHTQEFSHYRKPSSYELYLKVYADQVRAEWKGWDIVLLYLRRYNDRALQRGSHLEFWQRYFHDSGSTIRKVEGFD